MFYQLLASLCTVCTAELLLSANWIDVAQSRSVTGPLALSTVLKLGYWDTGSRYHRAACTFTSLLANQHQCLISVQSQTDLFVIDSNKDQSVENNINCTFPLSVWAVKNGPTVWKAVSDQDLSMPWFLNFILLHGAFCLDAFRGTYTAHNKKP